MTIAFTWTTSWSDLLQVVASAFVVLAAVIALIRIVGLRALSKMSGFDFAVTVAIGSILGSGVATDAPVTRTVVAIAALLGAQWLVAQARSRLHASQVIDNQPTLLVRAGRFDLEAMARTRVLRSDILAKLRQANVNSIDEVHAVVLETTGDMSIMHGTDLVDPDLLADVRGYEPQPAGDEE